MLAWLAAIHRSDEDLRLLDLAHARVETTVEAEGSAGTADGPPRPVPARPGQRGTPGQAVDTPTRMTLPDARRRTGELREWAPGQAADRAFPSRPVRIIVPFGTGAMVDVIPREIATQLSATWGQPVVVENRPGAASMIGAEYVARSPADGHPLLMANEKGRNHRRHEP